MHRLGKYIRYILILALGALCQPVFGQQEPIFSQDNFSIQTINPAYTGLWGTTTATALVRQQWLGLDGAPSTQLLIYQSSTKDKKVGYGLTIINDRIGFEKRFGLFGDYSYRIELNDETFLRLGLKLGFSNYSNNLVEYTIYDPNHDIDPVFQGKVEKGFIPNFGMGAFLHGENYYLGLSLPKVIQNELKNDANEYTSYAQIRHVFFKAGYVFDLADGIKFKPVVNTTIIIGAPVYIGFGANLMLQEKIWLGAFYRIGDSFGLSGQYYLNEKLNVGYAIDFSSSELSRYHYGTHEVIVTYTLKYPRRMKKGIPLF